MIENQDQLWNVFKEFVMFHPPNQAKPCLQLQTWALLKNLDSNLNAEGLGMTIKDKAMPTFFSRIWAASGYSPNSIRCDSPLLIANFIEINTFRPRTGIKTDVISFDLAVLDGLKDSKVRPNTCDARNEHQIFQDAFTILNQLFLYLQTIDEAIVTPLAGPQYSVITSRQRLDYLVSEVLISAYEIQETESAQIKHSFKRMVEKVQALPWRGGIGNLHGMFIPELKFTLGECQEQIELAFPDYPAEVNEQSQCC
jgi:hypothetical protein